MHTVHGRTDALNHCGITYLTVRRLDGESVAFLAFDLCRDESLRIVSHPNPLLGVEHARLVLHGPVGSRAQERARIIRHGPLCRPQRPMGARVLQSARYPRSVVDNRNPLDHGCTPPTEDGLPFLLYWSVRSNEVTSSIQLLATSISLGGGLISKPLPATCTPRCIVVK